VALIVSAWFYDLKLESPKTGAYLVESENTLLYLVIPQNNIYLFVFFIKVMYRILGYFSIF
jgi:hypothetical protein